MKAKETLITLVALIAIGITSFWAYRYEQKPNPSLCAVCNRSLHAGMSYRLETRARTEYACCPRCGMHYTLQHGAEVQRAWAVDFNTGEWVQAQAAYYDEGGDVEYCTHGAQPVERGPEGVAVRGYDRCLPTLVAFKTRDEAEAYQRQHGGRVLDYVQAIESVRTQ